MSTPLAFTMMPLRAFGETIVFSCAHDASSARLMGALATREICKRLALTSVAPEFSRSARFASVQLWFDQHVRTLESMYDTAEGRQNILELAEHYLEEHPDSFAQGRLEIAHLELADLNTRDIRIEEDWFEHQL